MTSPTKLTSGKLSLSPSPSPKYLILEEDLNEKKHFSSLGSVDEFAALEDIDDGVGAWQDELGDRMMQITERKKSSFSGREEAFSAYIRILCAKYAKEDIYPKKADLIDSMLRSIKSGRTEKEGLLASKGSYPISSP